VRTPPALRTSDSSSARSCSFLVVAGEEDLMVLAETVYEAENGVEGHTHRQKIARAYEESSQKAEAKSQKAKR